MPKHPSRLRARRHSWRRVLAEEGRSGQPSGLPTALQLLPAALRRRAFDEFCSEVISSLATRPIIGDNGGGAPSEAIPSPSVWHLTSAPCEIVLTDEFRHALALLADGKHLFLTGKAGTGKSTLIRRFMAETDRNVVVVAPTGIAALNVNGYTIHRLFGFRTTTTLHDVRGGDYRPGGSPRRSRRWTP